MAARAPVDRAWAVTGMGAAARLRDTFGEQIALNPQADADQLNEAIDVLEERFPELQDVDIGQADEYLSGRGHGTGSRTRGVQPAGGQPSSSQKRSPRDPAGVPPGAGRAITKKAGAAGSTKRGAGGSRSRSRSRSTSRAGSGRSAEGRRAWRETGIPSAARSGASIAYQAAGLGLMFSLLYLLLSDAQRRRNPAVAQIAEGFSAAVRAFISPYRDPLASVGGGGSSAPAPASSGATSSAGSGTSSGASSTGPGPHRGPTVSPHPGQKRRAHLSLVTPDRR